MNFLFELLRHMTHIHLQLSSLTKLLAKTMSGVIFIIVINSIVFLAVGLFQMETVIYNLKICVKYMQF